VTDEAPEVLFVLSFDDLPVVVPDPVGPFRVVLLFVNTDEDGRWKLHYAATGGSEGSVWIEAEDDAGNSFDVLSGGESRGDESPLVGWWTVTQPAGQRSTSLRLAFSFDEATKADEWTEDTESMRARARALIAIRQGQLMAATNRQLIADLMYTSEDRTTAVARLMEPPLTLSEQQAHHVADLSLGRLTAESRRLMEEELGAREVELRELGD
jgi:hypothetical protein